MRRLRATLLLSLLLPPSPAGEIGHKKPYSTAGAPARQLPSGRTNWCGRGPDWRDVKGFRGRHDLEKPVGRWNRLECVCDGDKITNILIDTVVNVGTRSSHTKGRITLQSEGAEIFFRTVELRPLAPGRRREGPRP